MNKVFNIRDKKNIIAIIHILLSFFYERLIFIFKLDQNVVLSIPMNDAISDNGERIVGYIFSKLFAVAMIFLLWYVIFWVKDNWKNRKNVKYFVLLFAVGLVGLLLIWPDPFFSSADNVVTYSYAIRFWPEYWHSAYTSFAYAGMLMVLPHPISITVYQWFFGVFVVGYLYNRIVDSPVLEGKGKCFVFLIFFMPGAFVLFSNPYRTEIYSLLCMYMIAQTCMDIIDKTSRGITSLVISIVLCGLVSVWRTEGIILGLLLFAVQLIFVYKYKLVKSAMLMALMILSFISFSVPQKLGDVKYYGKDYSFINSFPTLRNILSSPDANLTYDGVEEDFAALEAVAPVEILRYYGMNGYRMYNYHMGRQDINQSMADKQVAKEYMSAYYRMVAHNLPIYAKTQAGMYLCAVMLLPGEVIIYYPDKPENDIPMWYYAGWDIGKADYNDAPGVEAFSNTQLHIKASSLIMKIKDLYETICKKTYLFSILLLLIPVYDVLLFFAEAFKALKKKNNHLGLAGIAFFLVGQLAAIILVMPAGTLVYLHTYYYCSLILLLVYSSYLLKMKKAKK